MKIYETEKIRNIAVMGHGKTGKTSLLEACLFNAGATKRHGKVDEGSSVLDYSDEENRRKMSITMSLAASEWKDYKLNFLDTPGYPDFIGDVKGAATAADSALIVISAPSGIEVETEKAWGICEELNLPRAFFVNKMDREHANFDKVVEELRVRFGAGVVPVQLPIGQEETFQGVADLISLKMKIVRHEEDELPDYIENDVAEARLKLIEAVAEFNNELLEKYIEGIDIPENDVAAALIEGVQAGKIFPVFCGSAIKNAGIKKMMDGMIEYMPAPDFRAVIGTNPKDDDLVERTVSDPFSAQVFKTIVDPFVGRLSFIRIFSGTIKGDATYLNTVKNESERLSGIFSMVGKTQLSLASANAGDIVVAAKLANTSTGDTLSDKNSPIRYDPIVYPEAMLSMAVYAKKKGDEDKVFASIQKECEEDPTLIVKKVKETRETIINGIGEVHLEILAEKIKRKYSADMELRQPKIPYRETIRKSVKAEAKHKKQSGGHGQYGHVWLEISPNGQGEGNTFSESIFGGSVPRQFIPAVEKGTVETLAAGILAGYPVVDVKVNLFDGSYHTVDSSEAAFKTATAIALKKGVMDANPVLLEPIAEITVRAPEYYMGDVMGRLSSKRGKILGTESVGKDFSEVKAYVPVAELYKYATDLRSQTQGRGSFSLKVDHYEVVPERQAEKIIADAKKDKE
ncbi:MAG: elongation factor G [Selenomonadaceae bacterium]|nr:elongation factor G [Selenomonadaceae bacterium]